MRSILFGLVTAGVLASNATLTHAQETQISPNCLNFALSEKFDYLPNPLWMNRTLDRNEQRFLLNDFSSKILSHFADELSTRGKELYFVPIPDTAQFMPEGDVLYGNLLERFEDLYHFLNAQMEDNGFTPIDLMWLAERNRTTQDLHRNLDHHLLSRGRYLAAAQIAHRMEGASTLAPIHQIASEYDALPTEDFQVWKPTALNFAIDVCKPEIEQLPFDEYVSLPAAVSDGSLSMDSLFGDAPDETKVALLGTSQSLSAKGNLADFIAHFSETDVVNFAEAGGGSSSALQFAAEEGVLNDPSYDKLIWEVSTDFDSEQLAGAALSGLGHSQDGCNSEENFAPLAAITAEFDRWSKLPIDPSGGYVLALPNEFHTKGRMHLRFDFNGQPPVTTESWRWSQTQDPVLLGAWKSLIPDFEKIGLERPTAISFKFEGLYEYDPSGAFQIKPSICSVED